MGAAISSSKATSSDFDLDVTVVEHGPIIADLLNDTGDGCGSTCQSACSNSTCG
ncbi:FxLD family lanthipeptide [Streptomyces sp. NPDC053474]|uniref:FxLD family lanthipeptide n=1 Tax=Streptomyces sp. NPDC053474 TaxID=3365704 RepID=UPI0037D3ED26